MKLLAGFLAAAMAQDSDRWGYYDYYGNAGGKSQTSQTGVDFGIGGLGPNHVGDADPGTANPPGPQLRGTLGNGRICWTCSERSYGHCLGMNAMIGDSQRHGASYCTGEDYFCFISERRIIRHDGNDWNWEMGQPWSTGTTTVYQEENINHATSNMSDNTEIKVEMGCQQPLACLRQMNMNFKIEMGMSYHVNPASVPLATLPVVHGGLAREGMCRLGNDWLDYASGVHASDNWRNGNWQSFNSDRRYGAVLNHYHFGKGTESVCHYCCDPLLEFADADSDPTTPYDYMGCNYNRMIAGASSIATGNVDGSGNLAGNSFLVRSHNWESPVWYDATGVNMNGWNRQYHGMFRNPHTQYPHQTHGRNIGGSHPNARR